MSETDELRRMLNERDVEYSTKDSAFRDITYWPASNRVVASYSCSKYSETENGMFKTQFTPEQAIAATLGNGECENVAPDYLDFLCSVCGFVHYHSDENDTGDGNDWAYCPRCGKAVKR